MHRHAMRSPEVLIHLQFPIHTGCSTSRTYRCLRLHPAIFARDTGPGSALSAALPGSAKSGTGGGNMWLALFSFAAACAIGLSAAAVVIQGRQEKVLRG